MEERDPLLSCLKIICEMHQKDFLKRTLLAGLPLVDQKLTPNIFGLAAVRAGFKSKVLDISLAKLHKLDSGSILILHGNDACVLKRVREDHSCDLILSDGEEVLWSEDQVSENFSGYAIRISLAQRFEERVEQFRKAAPRNWFWSTIWLSKNIYGYIIMASFLINLFVFVSPIFVMNVYDRVIPNQAIDTLWTLVIGAVIFFTFDFIVKMFRGYLIGISGEITDEMLSEQLLKHTLEIKMENRPKSGGVLLRNFNDFWDLREFFASASMMLIVDLPFIILFILGIWFIGRSLVLVPLFAIPLALMINRILANPIARVSRAISLGSTQQQAILLESFSGLEIIKAISAESAIAKKWNDVGGMYIGNLKKSRMIVQFASNYTAWIQSLTVVVLMVYGSHLIIAGELSVGALVACSILTSRVMIIGQISNLLFRITRVKSTISALNALMLLQPERPNDKQFFSKEHISGSIRFDQVTFAYPGQHIDALKNVSFEIKPGERVGIVGRVGSGKSTLMKLCINLYSPNHGNILVDNVDVTEMDPINLRRHIQYVSTDSLLFYGTVRDNIRLCNPLASDERIIQASEIAGIDRFVYNNPEGYDAQVGERGENLSSGQRQAIAIARSLVTDAEVLMLDEPTASIDNHSAAEFMKRLDGYLTNQTLIMVTHRPSLLSYVDRLIILEDGKIKMDGPREEVLKHFSLRPTVTR